MRRIDQLDSETGEILSEGALVLVPRRTPHPYGDGWLAMRVNTIGRLTMHPGIGMQEMRVFGALLARLDFENFIHTSQAEIAEVTGIGRTNVNRAMKKLIEFGVLVEGPKVGRSRCYRLDAEAGWRGSKAALRTELRIIDGGRGKAPAEASDLPSE